VQYVRVVTLAPSTASGNGPKGGSCMRRGAERHSAPGINRLRWP
jgi:hypothetical protein